MTSSKRKAFYLIFLLLVFPFNAYANPQGESVVAGTASFDRSASDTLIVNTSSEKTIINYNSFSIATNEATRFNQPGSNSSVLNRVIGSDKSRIDGSLSSNGKLFLVNQNGVLFGPGSRVNAPGVVASTLDISNEDFLTGKYNFYKNGGGASIVNEGEIAAQPGGYVALLSQAVDNRGKIIADSGSIVLASGEKTTLALDSFSQVSVVVDEAVKLPVIGSDGKVISDAINNSGTIQANGGKIMLTAKVMNDVFKNAVNNGGAIEADAAQTKGGVVEFVAAGAPVVNTGSIVAKEVILLSDNDIISLGSLKVENLLERGNSFKIGGIFQPGRADVMNIDDAIQYVANTSISGTITDPANIVVDPSVTLTMTANTGFTAGGAFTMDSASLINGGGYNLSISAKNASTLGGINSVNLFALSSGSGSDVTFTSNASSMFQVTEVKTNYHSILSRNVGTGTAGDPIMIYSVSNAPGGLQYIPTSGLGLTYQLANNIDASETASWNATAGFLPIGDDINKFTGTLDGQGKAISGLFIDRSTTDYVGLIGYMNGATVESMNLSSVNITGQNKVGGLAGYNYESSIDGVDISGSVTGGELGYHAAGGLVGWMTGADIEMASINNSSSSVNVSGDQWVGGLVGYNGSIGGVISNSYATGNVVGYTSQSSWIGGLAGVNYSGKISSSYATGNVSGNSGVGGLVGENGLPSGVNGTDSDSYILKSYATGSVTVNSTDAISGGLVGQNHITGLISNSYATGDVVNGQGFVGTNLGGIIENTYAMGNVSGGGSGFTVSNWTGEISNSFTTASTTGVGFIEDATGGTITNCYYVNGSAGDGGTLEAGGANAFLSINHDVYGQSNNPKDWDFVSTWNIIDTQTYPKLQGFNVGNVSVAGGTLYGDMITNNFTVSSNTFDPNGNTLTINGALNNSGTLLVDTSTFGGNYSGFISITNGSSSTVNYSALTAQTIDSSLSPYNNLIISGGGLKTADGNLTVNGTFTITAPAQMALTVTAQTDTKTYDGTTSSSIVPNLTNGLLATGDNVAWSQVFDDPNVGTNKTLTPSGTVSDGNAGNDYSITFVNDTTGVINAPPDVLSDEINSHGKSDPLDKGKGHHFGLLFTNLAYDPSLSTLIDVSSLADIPLAGGFYEMVDGEIIVKGKSPAIIGR